MVVNNRQLLKCYFKGTKIFLWIVIFLFLIQGNLYAETIYFYKDSDGVLHFTDTPKSKKYKPMYGFGENTGVSKVKILKLIQKYSRRYRVDTELVHAVLQVESNYQNRAVSSMGAQGDRKSVV